jgi:hypothetical protein
MFGRTDDLKIVIGKLDTYDKKQLIKELKQDKKKWDKRGKKS